MGGGGGGEGQGCFLRGHDDDDAVVVGSTEGHWGGSRHGRRRRRCEKFMMLTMSSRLAIFINGEQRQIYQWLWSISPPYAGIAKLKPQERQMDG